MSLPVYHPRAARVVERLVQRRTPDEVTTANDQIVVEEPLEIRVGDDSLVVTMRTPGDDLDLTAGFLFSEGVITRYDDVASIAHAAATGSGVGVNAGNIVVVTPRPDRPLSIADARRVMRATAACGLCGKESIDAVRRRIAPIDSRAEITLQTVLSLPAIIRAQQPVFDVTGALHAVALFRMDGTLIAAKEDVGRHNAVDKVIGHQLRQGRKSFADTVMMFSGRAGFEIVQKAAVAGVPIVCAVSAPSSLAVDLAREVGMTLVGFIRGASANVYSHPFRVGGP